jgi:hypothetical protein
LFVTFDSEKHTTTSLLLHLLPLERDFIEQKLGDKALQPLMLHPLFVPTLVMELLFQETVGLLGLVYNNSIDDLITAELHGDSRYRHVKKKAPGIEKASETLLGNEQDTLTLCEKIESNAKMGMKLMSWFDEFPTGKMSADQRTRFISAGAIIQNRLQSLIDSFEFQLLRVMRMQGHTELNRLWVCTTYTLS